MTFVKDNDGLITAEVYAYTSREQMVKIVENSAMVGESRGMLGHFSEIRLEIRFDPKTGLVKKAKVIGHYE